MTKTLRRFVLAALLGLCAAWASATPPMGGLPWCESMEGVSCTGDPLNCKWSDNGMGFCSCVDEAFVCYRS